MDSSKDKTAAGRRTRRATAAAPAEGARRAPRSPRSDPPAAFPDDPSDRTGGKGLRGVRAYDRLREAIATGRLKPGARVLESELATLFDMVRTPVREAIAALEADGLVLLDGARGRVVTKLDYQSVMELDAVREVLESTAAGLAARNASDMEIVALRDMLEIEAQILDHPGRLADHNRRFHEAIYYCSHNRYILKKCRSRSRPGRSSSRPGARGRSAETPAWPNIAPSSTRSRRGPGRRRGRHPPPRQAGAAGPHQAAAEERIASVAGCHGPGFAPRIMRSGHSSAERDRR